MSDLDLAPWLIAIAVFFVVPFWRIAKRTGFKPAFAFIALVPGGIIVLLWVIAFAKWPALKETNLREANTLPDAGGAENAAGKETNLEEANRIEGGKTI
jgi:hypothetical protein